MYKGKFDQKQKGGNVRDILSQRNQSAAPDIPELKPKKAAPRPASGSAAPQKAAPQKAAPQGEAPQKPVQKAAPKAAPKQKGPRLGGVIFYTVYFLLILVFFIATFGGLLWLKGWLVDFEAAQPTVKSQQVFTQLFTDPDWDALYDASGAKDSPYEGKDAFVTYMEEKVGDQALTYLKTSAGLDQNKQKYLVRLGSEKVASFTLVDKNNVGKVTLLSIGSELPNWELGAVEVFFERSGSYRIEKQADCTAYVNGVPLDDTFTIQKATTKAEEFLPVGVTSAKMYTQEITGLMNLPTVTITDKQGNEKEVTYDAETRTFTQRTESNTMSDEEREVALKAAETYCKYMLEEANRGDLAKYFDTTSDIYKTLSTIGKLWVQDFSSYEFVDENLSNYERYTEDLFSVRVSMTVKVTRKDGSPKEFPNNSTMFFHKNDAGKWKIFEMVNTDVSTPVGEIRLTFMDGGNVIHSTFFSTNAREIITPVIPIPEGKVFTGWVREDVDAEGNKTLTLMFQPDETGKVVLPEGTELLPMTLYPLFENPDSVTALPQETTEGAE